jgi:uncharacterized protein YndB with AHSA1/START domain
MEPRVDRELILRAPPDQVWAALADPERLGAWLGARVDIDLRPGGAASFHFDDGESRRGVVQQVEEGHTLSFTWWPVARPLGEQTTVTISLDEHEEASTWLRVREAPSARARAAA